MVFDYPEQVDSALIFSMYAWSISNLGSLAECGLSHYRSILGSRTNILVAIYEKHVPVGSHAPVVPLGTFTMQLYNSRSKLEPLLIYAPICLAIKIQCANQGDTGAVLHTLQVVVTVVTTRPQ